MQQFTTYGAKIHMESAKPVQAMVRIYRDAVSYLIRVCMERWEGIIQIKTLQAQQMYVEKLIHHTKNRPAVAYEDFDKLFYKLPSYIRRSAISEAIGKVESYQGNLKRWEKEGIGKAPGKPVAGYTYPVLYRDNSGSGTPGTGWMSVSGNPTRIILPGIALSAWHSAQP